MRIERTQEMRTPCKEWGHIARSHGWDIENPEPVLGPCLCGTFEACEGCGEPHVYVDRCEPCGSRWPALVPDG